MNSSLYCPIILSLTSKNSILRVQKRKALNSAVCYTSPSKSSLKTIRKFDVRSNESIFYKNYPAQSFALRSARITCPVKMTAEPTVLIPIGNGSEEMETSIMVDVLRRAGAKVTLASVEEDLVCTMSRQMKFVADCFISECADQTYSLIALPGGMPGAERLRDCQVLTEIIKAQVAANQPIAAMCAAPAVCLEPLGVLEGKAATAHPAFVNKIGGSSGEGRVVVDGSLITSRGPGTAIEFALAMVEMLFNKEKAKEIARPMVIPPVGKVALVEKEWLL